MQTLSNVHWLISLVLAASLTVPIALALGRTARRHLQAVFNGDDERAHHISRALTIAVYLVGFGFSAVWVDWGYWYYDFAEFTGHHTNGLGGLALVLGIATLIVMAVLARFRRTDRPAERRSDIRLDIEQP